MAAASGRARRRREAVKRLKAKVCPKHKTEVSKSALYFRCGCPTTTAQEV